MVWFPARSRLGYCSARGAQSAANLPVGGIADVDPAANQIAEGSPNGTSVGITALATDPTPGDTVTYTLDNNAGGRFGIGTTSGIVIVNDSLLIDSNDGSYSIIVRATSSDGSFSTRSFTFPVVPSGGSTLSSQDWLGMWSGANPGGSRSADETALGYQIAYQHVKIPFDNGFDQADFSANAQLPGWVNLGIQNPCIFDLYPTNRSTGPEYAAIAAGTYNTRLRSLANIIKNTGQTNAILRLWHEFDSNGTHGIFSPGTTAQRDNFVAAWRVVHDEMKSQAPNLRFAYQPDGPGSNPGGTTINGEVWIDYAWPGSDYVDIIGFSGYNRGNGITVAGALAKNQYVWDWAVSKNKPFSIGEWGLWPEPNGAGDFPAYITAMYNWLQDRPASGAGALIYALYFGSTTGSYNASLSNFPNSLTEFTNLFGA